MREGAEAVSESKTPETDAILNRYWNPCNPDAVFQLTNHARRLEAERDALREGLRECESLLRRVGCDITADRARALLDGGKG